MNIVNLHIGKLNLYYVAYLYNGRNGERERVPCRIMLCRIIIREFLFKTGVQKQSCNIIIILHYYMENCIYTASPMFIVGNLIPS